MRMIMKLEQVCNDCGGTGESVAEYYSSNIKRKCYYCGGSGKIPSEYGKELINFIKNYVKLETLVN